MEFANKAELIQFLSDLKGQMDTLQQQLDALAPVEAEAEPAAEGDAEGALLEDTSDETAIPAEEVDEIDSLLQEK